MTLICPQSVRLYFAGGRDMITTDVQLKRGLLETCVLAAIKKEDSYGYKIIKDISPYIEISESTLYPILKRLESSGSITVYSVEHNGRLRKYYRITDSGKNKISEFLVDWKDVTKAYNFISGEDLENE